MTEEQPLWTPSRERIEASEMKRFMRWLEAERGLRFEGYAALWTWSVTEIEAFWDAIAAFFDVRFSARPERVLDRRVMPGAKWFEGAKLNYADQAFRRDDDPDRAAIRWTREGAEGVVSWGGLRAQVASLAARLRGMGVVPGDRVVAILPNAPESVIAFLAVVSVGAIWSQCSPDMGKVVVVDRFRQIAPKVLIAVDGYLHTGKTYDRRETVNEIASALPTLENMVTVAHLGGGWETPVPAVSWDEATGDAAELRIEQVDFAHPLWIVYSSGTTGNPKPIVHGHGGVLLEALKTSLHLDLTEADTYCWLTSSGWIMWNTQISPLLRGAAIAMFDGAPAHPDAGRVWRFLAETGTTFFGAGAAFFTAMMKTGLVPREIADLSRVRTVSATGSPLPPEAYDWIYANVAPDAWLAPISGGTDFAGAFVGGTTILPVFAGEMQCRYLGAAVYAFDEQGRAVEDEVGELVCTEPMPSMPLFFWGDEDGSRYRDSYFDMFPGVWRHGDWIRITPRGGAVIYGRSDATINRRGIRIGTSEIYRAVEELPEVLDSLVVDLEFLGRPSWMPLFVVLREGLELDDALRGKIMAAVRESISARYCPNEIVQIAEVPRTLSGKKLEVPVKKLLLGDASGVGGKGVVNRDSMANPASFDFFVRFAEEHGPRLRGEEASAGA